MHRRASSTLTPPSNTKLLHQAARRVHATASAAAGATAAAARSLPPQPSAASLVWGLAPTASPSVHVVTHPQLAVAEVVPLALDVLHPDVLTKNSFTEFLAQNLISRAARRHGTIALVLSAAYLPSQLDFMRDLAAKQSVELSVFIGRDTRTLHAVFRSSQQPSAAAQDEEYQQQEQQASSSKDITTTLAGLLGPLEPLSPARLQVAQQAERGLQQQLRLWDAATWSSVLQQQLESSRRSYGWLAIRGHLLGPPALQAAQQLVSKKGLHWLEVAEEQTQAPSGGQAGASGGSTGGSRRRNRGTSVGGKGGDEQEQQAGGGGGGGVVIVLSAYELTTAEEVVSQVAQLPTPNFTDVVLGGGGGGGDEGEAGAAGDSQEGSERRPPSFPSFPNLFGR